MTDRNPTANPTVLSGDIGLAGTSSDNSYHVLTGAAGVLIDGFTVTAGNANGTSDNAQSGAFNKCEGMTIVNCSITDNSALFGGAMVASSNLPLQVVNSLFSGNRASNIGAIIDITSSTAVVSFTNTIFRRNFSGTNGSIFNPGASPVFTSCIFDSNSAGVSLYGFYSEGGNPRFVNCVVYNDLIYNSSSQTGQIIMTNCIVWGSSAISGSASVTYSCFAVSHPGTGNIVGNPLFVNLQAGDFHIKPGSPCIDKANGSEAPALDFDGKARYDYPSISNADQVCADIGAFECTTPNNRPVITGAQVSGGFMDEAITIALDSLTVQDNDNTYPDDFTIIPGSGNFTVVTSTKTYVRIMPQADSSTTIAIPIRVRDLIDTSAPYTILVPVKRRVVYVDVAASGLNNGSSWKNAYCNLKIAMLAASLKSEIWVAKGTYLPVLADSATDRTSAFMLVSKGPPLYGGFAGTESSKAERNWRVNETILSGDIGRKGDSSDNCFHVVVGADNATIDGFVITGGYADTSASFLQSCGGGMLNNTTSPTISNCTFRRNYAMGGGAMYNYWDASPRITNCTFCYNAATDTAPGSLTNRRGGGAIFNDWSSTPTIINSLFYRNSVTSNGWGAAIYHYWGDTMNVVNCTFFDNSDPGNKRTGFAVEWGSTYLRNSIMKNTTIGDLDGRGKTFASYDCFDPGTVMSGTGNIFVVPGFADTAANDFHLAPTSLCIDQASGLYAPLLDMDGKGRYDKPNCDNVDTAYADIGAFEYNPTITDLQPDQKLITISNRYSLDVETRHASVSSIGIIYAIPASAGVQEVHFSIFNLKGVRVMDISAGPKSPGIYTLSWCPANSVRGFYFCRMKVGSMVIVKKFLIVR